jgi:streptogramin lyase
MTTPAAHAPDAARTSSDHTTIRLPPAGPSGPRRRWRLVAAVLAAVALVGGGAAVFLLRQSSHHATRVPQVPRAIDQQAGFVGSPIDIGRNASDVIAYDGSIWVSNWRAHVVLKVDPESGAVERISAAYPMRLEAGLGAIWADDSITHLARIDASTGQSTWITHEDYGDQAAVFTVGQRRVWVARQGGTTIDVIDPDSARVVDHIRAGDPLLDLAAGRGLVLAVHKDGTVTVIDESSGRATRTLQAGGRPASIEYENGVLYTLTGNRIVPVDVTTGRQRAPIELGTTDPAGWWEVAGGRVWVSSTKSRVLRQYDTRTGREVGSALATRSRPLTFNIAPDGRVWLARADGLLVQVASTGGSQLAPPPKPTAHRTPEPSPTPAPTETPTATPTATATPQPAFTERIHISTWWSDNPFASGYAYVHFKAVDKHRRTVEEVLGSDSVDMSEEQAALKETVKRRQLVDKLRAELVDAGWTEIGLRSGGEWYEYEFGR